MNQIYNHTSEDMHELPDESVHLVVTSPPYNVGKEYEENLTSGQYHQLLNNVWFECYRVLVDGGRVCINIANTGRSPYIPISSWIVQNMILTGYLMRGEIIWDKGASVGASTAWGSWRSPSNPSLRDVHEYILVFCKGEFRLPKPSKDSEATIERDDFLEWTKSIWSFPTASAKRIGHPAPFPVELPARCIQLYSYSDSVVLDPFMGSGTTAVAAKQLGRQWVGYETSQEYCELARSRINEKGKKKQDLDLEKEKT